MAGPGQIHRLCLGVDRSENGRRPIFRRNASRNAAPGIDRYGEGCPKCGGVLRDHQRKLKLVHMFRRQREADQPASMGCHEVDRLRRHLLGCHDEIAFILTIFIVDKNDHMALLDCGDGVLNGVHFHPSSPCTRPRKSSLY